MHQHQAGFEVRARHHHEHRVDAREASQRHALVRDPVLRADDGHVVDRGLKIAQRRLCVLRLHRQDHDVIVAEGDLRGVADGGDVECDGLLGRAQRQASTLDRIEVGAAADQHHVMAVLIETAADAAADAASAVDDVSHVDRYRRAHQTLARRGPGPCASALRVLVGWR